MSYQLSTSPLLTLVGVVAEVRGIQRIVSLGGRDPRRAALAALTRVWPGTYPEAISTDYPGDPESVDAWSRAALCHGVIDALDSKPPRGAPVSGVHECRLAYVAIYSLVRTLMGPKA